MRITLLFRLLALTIGILISLLSGASASNPGSSGAYSLHQFGSAGTVMTSFPESACPVDAGRIHRRPLSGAFLHEPPARETGPHVVVDHYNLSEGLLAAYQASSGKRILFRARFRADGSVQAEATHFNAHTGEIERFLGPATRQSGTPAQSKRSMQLVGVDLLEYFTSKVGEAPPRGQSHDRIVTFLDTDVGHALFEAIPALYAALEPLEDSRKLTALQTPYGMVLTGLQLKTGRYSGFGLAEWILGPAEANRLHANCKEDRCQFRGVNFSVHSSGLFDIVSKRRLDGDPAQSSCATGKPPAGSAIRKLLLQKEGENQLCIDSGGGDCFGYCGAGCVNPGNIWTTECFGHDLCVCRFGDDACVISVPEVPPGTDSCGMCTDFGTAFLSWLREMFDGTPEYGEDDSTGG